MAKNKFVSILLKSVVTLVILAVIVGAIVGLKAVQIGEIMAAVPTMQPPPASVATANPQRMDWPVESKAVGTVTPVQGVTLSVESPGIITELSFESGQDIEQGDVILKLDTRSERAQLSAAEAARDLAKISLERSSQLLDRKTISQAEFDAADAEYKQAVANVENIIAAIEKKEIVAPFDGRLGIRRVNLGEYLNPGTSVVSLQSTDPIYVSFYLPQKDLSYLEVGLEVLAESDAYPEVDFIGTISAVAAEVNDASRMIEVQATLPNPDGRLTAGMFVNVSIARSQPRSVMAVPSSAVLYASYGNSIYVVMPAEEGDGLIAEQKFVRLGERRGDFVEVLEGLSLEDNIVSAGAFKLIPGAPVAVSEGREPEYDVNPDPDDA
ncbi:efflux RND transporter periplasmic adaptor subunit [Coraliomargarita akajimensis]|uniref:Efflux transporter, RND family, MFP subunit n=1 Tax=Coraliomargarita akajimensis (strain DSM 45221 / IAM 15411 / JCM 23193 / KCTC 12865 / 04OKA010-24) TaxID=583355 RepID=D5EL82_CORAD|nr:efflux RND transporter periplasmic adaptor subunit [Coraliomargarita akajimensis]ADE53184.1 efflux transporter, RND family, MFP subunit [Coraliomargarita akajimensis DSM 45221]